MLWWIVRRVEGMGMGDIKLLLLIGAVLGPWPSIPFVLFVSSMLAVIFMVPIQLIKGGTISRALPFGRPSNQGRRTKGSRHCQQRPQKSRGTFSSRRVYLCHSSHPLWQGGC